MKTKLPAAISSKQQAEQFLTDLYNNNELYHPEDSAHEIVWDMPEEQQPSVKECKTLNTLMDQIHEHLTDPCEFCMQLMTDKEGVLKTELGTAFD